LLGGKKKRVGEKNVLCGTELKEQRVNEWIVQYEERMRKALSKPQGKRRRYKVIKGAGNRGKD